MSALDEVLEQFAAEGCDGDWHAKMCAARAELAELRDSGARGRKALDFIDRRGYVRCDIPACNCGSWHGGNAEARLRDFHEALVNADVETNGKTLLGALGEVLAELAELRAALSELYATRSVAADIEDGMNVVRCTDAEWDAHVAACRKARAALRGKEGT